MTVAFDHYLGSA